MAFSKLTNFAIGFAMLGSLAVPGLAYAEAKGSKVILLTVSEECEYCALHQKAFKEVAAAAGLNLEVKITNFNAAEQASQVAQAIATFERTVYSANAPYDRYQNGDKQAMSEAQVRGMNVFFNKAACDACHLGFNFTDGSFANIGIGMDKKDPDLGRFIVTGRDEERGAFKTPTLREIEHTAPYMHDGRFKTLAEVVAHYCTGMKRSATLDPNLAKHPDGGVPLSAKDQAALVAFLETLTDEKFLSTNTAGIFAQK